MEFYFVVLFFHISGAFVLFMGMSLEWVGISKLNGSANSEQAREWVKFLSSLKFAYISAGFLLLITGIYLAAAKWGWTPWIIVSFLLWLFLVVHGSAVINGKVKRFGKSLDSAKDLTTQELQRQISKLKLLNLLQTRLVVGLGAVFIMTVKPNLVGAVVVVIVAVILGIVPLLFKKNSSAPELAESGRKN